MRSIAFVAGAVCAAMAAPCLADVKQGIEMTSVGSPFSLSPNEWPAISSPDGRYEALVVYSGDVASDTNRYRILVADARARAGTPPKTVFVLVTRNDARIAGISELRWLDDRSLTALVVGKKGSARLVRIDTQTGQSANVSSEGEDIVDYAESAPGDLIALICARGQRAARLKPSAYAGSVIGSEEPYALLGDEAAAFSRYGFGSRDNVLLLRSGKETSVPLPAGEFPMPDVGLSVSPSGRFVIIPVGMFRSEVPPSWLGPSVPPEWVFFYGMRIYDRNTKTLRWLIDQPAYWESPVAPIWSADEKAVFISNQFLRKPDGNPTPGAALVGTETGQILASIKGAFARDGGNSDLVGLRVMEASRPENQFRVGRTGTSWRFVGVPANGKAIRLVQSMNRPPALAWHDFATGRETHLLDLNPGMRFGDVQVRQFTWTLRDGSSVTGGLYLPENWRLGRRLPLIIQTHGWDASQFWYDGPSTAGFAARSLAECGFAVAQIGWLPHPVAPTAEISAEVDMIDRLIDGLDNAGIIDTGKLGITAWSASGLEVRSALAFSRHHFAAAVLVDSRDVGFFNYLLLEPGHQNLFDAEMGGMPFGAGLDAWRRNSPMFNMDRVTTPVRLVSLGPRILAQWEQWASMRRLGRPIEFIWLPGSNHWPTRPSQRMEAQQGTVDWYRFWLLGVAPTGKQENAEFSRWEKLRAEQHESDDRIVEGRSRPG